MKISEYPALGADHTQNGGGVAAYLRSDIAGDRKSDLDFKHIEGMNIKVNLNRDKWLVSGAYKPPSMSDELFDKWLVSGAYKPPSMSDELFEDCTLGLDKIRESMNIITWRFKFQYVQWTLK